MALSGGIFTGANQAIDANRADARQQEQLGLQQQGIEQRKQALEQKQNRQLFQDNRGVITGMVKAALQSNKAPEQITQLIQPLMDSARRVLDPKSMLALETEVSALAKGPTGQQAAVTGALNESEASKVRVREDPMAQAKLAQTQAATAASNRSNREGAGGTKALSQIGKKASDLRAMRDQGLITDDQYVEGINGLVNEVSGKKDETQKSLKVRDYYRKNAAKVRQAQTDAIDLSGTVNKLLTTISNNKDTIIGDPQGLFGMVAQFFPKTEARTMSNQLQRIKANVSFKELQKMRNNSPTGGALGQVSNMENKLLQATNGVFDQFEDPAELEQRLISLREQYKSYAIGVAIENAINNGEFSDEQRALAERALDALAQNKLADEILPIFEQQTGVSLGINFGGQDE